MKKKLLKQPLWFKVIIKIIGYEKFYFSNYDWPNIQF